MIGPELTIQLVAMRLLAGIAIAMVHSLAIARVAVLLGDDGPRHDGRTRPFSSGHISLPGIGALMLTGFGWAAPVTIAGDRLKGGRIALVLPVLAGSAALLLLGFVLLLLASPALRALDFTAGVTAAAFVRVAGRLCVWIALFSLLPVPPLAGAHLLEAMGVRFPPRAAVAGAIALTLASLAGWTQWLLTPAYKAIAPLVLGADVALT
ncbi:zinc metalloprotease [Alsobacter sp. R-9]